jgi:hypothetical protein
MSLINDVLKFARFSLKNVFLEKKNQLTTALTNRVEYNGLGAWIFLLLILFRTAFQEREQKKIAARFAEKENKYTRGQKNNLILKHFFLTCLHGELHLRENCWWTKKVKSLVEREIKIMNWLLLSLTRAN